MVKYINSVRFCMKSKFEFGESPSNQTKHYEIKINMPVTIDHATRHHVVFYGSTRARYSCHVVSNFP